MSELRKQIAEALGWTFEQGKGVAYANTYQIVDPNGKVRGRMNFGFYDEWIEPRYFDDILPNWDTDLNAALNLLGGCEEIDMRKKYGLWRVFATRYVNEREAIEVGNAENESLLVAICKAFLKMKGIAE